MPKVKKGQSLRSMPYPSSPSSPSSPSPSSPSSPSPLVAPIAGLSCPKIEAGPSRSQDFQPKPDLAEARVFLPEGKTSAEARIFLPEGKTSAEARIFLPESSAQPKPGLHHIFHMPGAGKGGELSCLLQPVQLSEQTGSRTFICAACDQC